MRPEGAGERGSKTLKRWMLLAVWTLASCSNDGGQPCAEDTDCPAGEHCGEDEVCTLECRLDIDCLDAPGGGTCDERGRCTGCMTDSDCDDGVYCNGAERCEPTGCVPGANPCGSGSCEEVSDTCGADCPGATDMDGDGVDSRSCGGTDCDDGDPRRFPGNMEVCDADDLDEDCDPETFGFRDQDMDGFPDARCCNEDICGTDCDDNSAVVHPGEADSCDGLDNDCNGTVDDGSLEVWYPDVDRDDFGDPDGVTVMSCSRPDGYTDNDDDCDDSIPTVNPAGIDDCNGVDDDCDENTDEVPGGCSCVEGPPQACGTDAGECSMGTRRCISGEFSPCGGTDYVGPRPEVCNGLDDNCDGTSDEGLRVDCWPDADNDGYAEAGTTSTSECRDFTPIRASEFGECPLQTTFRDPASAPDCDDDDARRYPGAVELCDGIDNNCVGGTDEVAGCECVPMEVDTNCGCNGLGSRTCQSDGTWGACSETRTPIRCYFDDDRDGFAPSGAPQETQCGSCGTDWTATPPATGTTDCDDDDAARAPDHVEGICNSRDDDCRNGPDDTATGCTGSVGSVFLANTGNVTEFEASTARQATSETLITADFQLVKAPCAPSCMPAIGGFGIGFFEDFASASETSIGAPANVAGIYGYVSFAGSFLTLYARTAGGSQQTIDQLSLPAACRPASTSGSTDYELELRDRAGLTIEFTVRRGGTFCGRASGAALTSTYTQVVHEGGDRGLVRYVGFSNSSSNNFSGFQTMHMQSMTVERDDYLSFGWGPCDGCSL